MPTRLPASQPKAASVGVVDLFAPGVASPCATSTGVTLPVSTLVVPLGVCMVSILGAAPKPCAPRSVKLAATVATGTGNPPGIGFGPTRIRSALAVPASAHEKLAANSNFFNVMGRPLLRLAHHHAMLGTRIGQATFFGRDANTPSKSSLNTFGRNEIEVAPFHRHFFALRV